MLRFAMETAVAVSGLADTLCCLGFMTPEERKIFENLKSPHLKYWVPVVWFTNLASKARKEGRIQDSVDLQTILTVSAGIPQDPNGPWSTWETVVS